VSYINVLLCKLGAVTFTDIQLFDVKRHWSVIDSPNLEIHV